MRAFSGRVKWSASVSGRDMDPVHNLHLQYQLQACLISKQLLTAQIWPWLDEKSRESPWYVLAFGQIHSELWTDSFYNLHLTMVERILLICISVRHLDRAPAFAWAPQADPSHKGYNSWGISGVISAYKYNSLSFRNMRMPRDLF